MTTYTFVPKSAAQLVNWDDPTVWAAMVVPNAADADVVFPLATASSTGAVYTSDITIKSSESYTTRSVADTNGYLLVNGSLYVTGALTLGANGEIDLGGGTLSFGSLSSTGYDIQGSGQMITSGTLVNTQRIVGSGLTVTANSLLNKGSLIATGTLTITLTGGNAGSDVAGGVLTSGVYEVQQNGTMILNTGAAITAIDATVEVVGGSMSGTGDILSYDPTTASTLPLQQTLQTIRPSGDLVVQGQYTTSHDLTDDGTITLQAGTLSAPGLTVDASGQVFGYGTVIGPVRNDGSIKAGSTTAGMNTGGNATLLLDGSVSGAGTLAVASFVNNTRSTLELAGSDTENVSFRDGSGTLVLDNPSAFDGTITVALTSYVARQATTYGSDRYDTYNDTILLTGTPFSSVTGYKFSPTAAGGTLTIQEGATEQTLAFADDDPLFGLTTASFALSAGPQALSTSPPSLSIVVTLALTTPAVPITGDFDDGILSTQGVGIGPAVAASPQGTPSSATPNPGLGQAPQQVVATVTNAGGTTTPAPSVLDVLPAPVNGVITTATTSLDVAKLLGQGYGFQFIGGTEALQLTNGTLSVGPDTTQALVQRFYEGLLGRSGDTLGSAGFNAMLANGGSPASAATIMLTSSEYETLHGAPASQTDTQFVTSLYQGFLGRAPDQPNLTGWVNALTQGTSRGQVAADFAQSAEAKTNLASVTAHVWVPDPQGALVTELYETGLGRAPDLASLQAWKQQLNAGLTPLQLAQGVATSAEFNVDHAGSSNEAFVTSLYQAGLGRTPAASELQGWVGQLQAGAGSTNVLYGIATSAEAGSHLLPSI